jgi:hypothetical protein
MGYSCCSLARFDKADGSAEILAGGKHVTPACSRQIRQGTQSLAGNGEAGEVRAVLRMRYGQPESSLECRWLRRAAACR